MYRKGIKVEVHEVQPRGVKDVELDVVMRCTVTEYLDAVRETGRILLQQDVHKHIALKQEDKDLLMYIRNLDLTYPSQKVEQRKY